MRELLDTYSAGLDLKLVEVGALDGHTDLDEVRSKAGDQTAALLLAQPNFFGVVEDVRVAADLVHAAGARLVVSFDPLSAGLLEPPGRLGADVVVGEGQSLGNHPNFGGPAFGFLACAEADVRRLPGRLVGETLDADSQRAFVLTLQAREQHIRREKATSNICTNQTLNAVAAAVYLSWLGPAGLAELGERCLRAARYAADRLSAVPGVSLAYPDQPFVKEFVLRLPADPAEVCRRLADRGWLAGLPLGGLAPHCPTGCWSPSPSGARGRRSTAWPRHSPVSSPSSRRTAGDDHPDAGNARRCAGAGAVGRGWQRQGRAADLRALGARATGQLIPSRRRVPAGRPVGTVEGVRRTTPVELPEVSERDLVRHHPLAHRNFAIDLSFYPLGSCTMKYNPKIAETVAALPGFARLHPAQPVEQVQGALEVLWRLEHALKELTGLAGVTFQPAAGAHGELTGLLIMRAYHEAASDPAAAWSSPTPPTAPTPPRSAWPGSRS